MSEGQAPDTVPASDAQQPISQAETPESTSTRRQREGEGPSGDLDQLLDEPPRGDHHLGRFAGYRDGRGVRRAIAFCFLLCGIAMIAAFVVHSNELEARYAQEQYERLHPWKLPDGTDTSTRSRDFHWTEGSMRIPLSREAPGIERVILPDKVIWLAEGVDDAQVRVEVVDGKTLGIKVLSGDVQHRDRKPGENF